MKKSTKRLIYKLYGIGKVMLFITIIVAMIVITVNAFKVPEPVDYECYVVKSGDTLWSIAAKSDGYESMDVRHIIDAMKNKSNVSANIYPGDVIYVPMYND